MKRYIIPKDCIYIADNGDIDWIGLQDGYLDSITSEIVYQLKQLLDKDSDRNVKVTISLTKESD